jgi:phage terminase large subunit-like protein
LNESSAATGTCTEADNQQSNLDPTKARPEQKIDAAAALIIGVGRVMTEPEQFTSIFDWVEL